ncbi:cation diffusion facilitator family transporter [Crocinitomix catalasitica]|uniref:cation diffusion facilitator family transporter n=1 Tax=Crocinitomix catalasitica TaxID=184607 RepID=UPI00047FA27E|nr:cation diffusion facilitator family transporter [Crocinitomix catalasitica]
MGHHHSHHHSSKNLKTAFFLNVAFTFMEFIGGIYVNSVAIVSDAIHDLGDSLSLGFAWFLDVKSKKSATKSFTFGYSRLSLLGALINSVVLIVGSIFVINEAVSRFINPELSDANGMIVFALFGIAVNGYAAWKLSGAKTLNEKVVSWHLMEDVLGWFAVLIAAIVLKFYESPYIDPALSIAITAYILFNVIKRLKETLFLFLQGTPDDIDINNVENELITIEQINSVHHTHVWSLDGEQHVFTTHVKLNNIDSLLELAKVKAAIKSVLKQYPFKHHTVEVELSEETCRMEEEHNH